MEKDDEVLEEIDFIQQLPEIDLLINSLVTRLNNRGSDSIFCLPAVVGCLSLVLKGNELENVVLSEKNIIQLMRLCLSRAVYPNTSDSNPLPFASYQEICVCRMGLRGLLATSTVAQSTGAMTEINTFITKWYYKKSPLKMINVLLIVYIMPRMSRLKDATINASGGLYSTPSSYPSGKIPVTRSALGKAIKTAK